MDKSQLEVLEQAGILSPEQEKELAALRGGTPIPPEPTPTPAQSAGTPSPTPAATEQLHVTDSIFNPKKFKESANYQIYKEGLFRSALVNTVEPNTDKPQRWFIFETRDPVLKKPNRGVYVGEFDLGAGIYRQLLDSLGIEFTFDEASGQLDYNLNLPLPCWADWSKDPKGIGGVKISGLKPITADINQSMI